MKEEKKGVHDGKGLEGLAGEESLLRRKGLPSYGKFRLRRIITDIFNNKSMYLAVLSKTRGKDSDICEFLVHMSMYMYHTSGAAPNLSIFCFCHSEGWKQDHHHPISLNCCMRGQEGLGSEKTFVSGKM